MMAGEISDGAVRVTSVVSVGDISMPSVGCDGDISVTM